MIPSTSFPTLGVGDGQDLSPAEATKRPLSGRRNPKPAALTSTLGNQCQDSHQHHPSAEVWECGLHPQALAETVWGLTRTWKPRPVALRRNSRPRGPCGARPGLTPLPCISGQGPGQERVPIPQPGRLSPGLGGGRILEESIRLRFEV